VARAGTGRARLGCNQGANSAQANANKIRINARTR
jgi:hypothetical protein